MWTENKRRQRLKDTRDCQLSPPTQPLNTYYVPTLCQPKERANTNAILSLPPGIRQTK